MLPVLAFAADTPPAKADYTAYGDTELLDALKANQFGEKPDWCGVAVPLTREMMSRKTFPPEAASLQTFSDMMCAAAEKRWADAYRLMLTVEKSMDERADIIMGVSFAFLAGEYDAAEARLFPYLDSPEVKQLTADEAGIVWDLARTYAKAHDKSRGVALFRRLSEAPRLAKFPDEDRDAIGSRLFILEVETGDIEAASKGLSSLKSPYAVRQALGDRRFEPLWPQIEAATGPNMAKTIDGLVDRAQRKFDADPWDTAALKDLANAYLMAGRFEDVVALVGKKEPSAEDYDLLTEDMAWALNTKIYALDALGRGDDAEIIFDRIAALEHEGARRGWLVNFVINRASRLVGRGQAEKGLKAVELAEGIAAEAGSDFARMLVRSAKMCALQASGRTADIAQLLAEVTEHADKSPAEAAEAMLCAGADDQAAKVVRDALNDPAQSSTMVESLQSSDFDLYYSESKRPRLSDRIRHRPDVAPLFDKVGRDIPRDFAPLFTLRRSARQAALPKP